MSSLLSAFASIQLLSSLVFVTLDLRGEGEQSRERSLILWPLFCVNNERREQPGKAWQGVNRRTTISLEGREEERKEEVEEEEEEDGKSSLEEEEEEDTECSLEEKVEECSLKCVDEEEKGEDIKSLDNLVFIKSARKRYEASVPL